MFHMRASGAHGAFAVLNGIAHCVSDGLRRSAIDVTHRAASPVTGTNGGRSWRQCACRIDRRPGLSVISNRAPFAISTSRAAIS